MSNYLTGVLSTTATPQSEPIPGSTQVPNSAGGYSFAVDDWMRLRRFLILGSEGGSYYASERTLTVDNAQCVLRCIQADGLRTVEEIVAISDAGRAPKNDAALFALAMASGLGDVETKKAAFAALPKVARIGTHLFHFVAYMEQFRHWGRLAREGVGDWYTQRSLKNLAEQAVKYQSRDGWGHRDLLRLAHPAPGTEERAALFRYMGHGFEPDNDTRGKRAKTYLPDERAVSLLKETPDLQIVAATEAAKAAKTEGEVVTLIRDHGLPRETVPTQWLDSREVWDALLPTMGITALIRNLAKMTSVGLLASGSESTRVVLDKITNQDVLRKGRVHPIALLVALMTYRLGHGVKGSLKWEPVTAIIDALDRSFYLSFGNVEPSGKVWEMWLDVSGSMGMGEVAGINGFTPRIASGAFGLVTASVERQCEFYGFSHQARKLNVSPRQRLDDVLKTISGLDFGGTDCSLPMQHALAAKRYVDVFCVLTDSETWFGNIHPVQALARYRREVNPNAKLIVVGMVANEFSIADPKDPGMLDVVGFDTAAPTVMSDFAAGRL